MYRLSVALLVLFKMSVLSSVARNTDVLVLLEAFSGSANDVIRLLLVSVNKARANLLVLWNIQADWAALQDYRDQQISAHILQLEAEHAADVWEYQFRFEEAYHDE